MKMTPRRSRAVAGILVVALGHAGPAAAVCRPNAELQALERRMAVAHFPELAKLPTIEGCDDPRDMPGAVGEFASPQVRIRVLLVTDTPREVIVAHELGHALVYQLGQPRERFGGHGEAWLRVMMRAGFSDEALRTAQMDGRYPGLLTIHAQVARIEARVRVTDGEGDIFATLNAKAAWASWLTSPVD